jgi:hypothetical protein
MRASILLPVRLVEVIGIQQRGAAAADGRGVDERAMLAWKSVQPCVLWMARRFEPRGPALRVGYP